MKRCSVLYIGSNGDTHVAELRRLGFVVAHHREWPGEDQLFTGVEAVVVTLRDMDDVATLAMRLRAKRNFNRRVLIATVDGRCTPESVRSAQVAGVDWVFPSDVPTRTLAARMLKILRTRTEHPCQLPPERAA